jgi:HK97 family phage major capsid protein
MQNETGVETKVVDLASSADTRAAFDDLMRAVAEMRDTSERRLGEVERKMAGDVVTTEKLARLDEVIERQQRLLDAQALKAARPPLGGPAEGADNPLRREHKAAFERYVRRGVEQGLYAIEAKTFSVGTNSDGGFLVPPETEAAVNRSLRDLSPIRAISDVRQVSAPLYQKPYATSEMGAGWVAETAPRPQTTRPNFTNLTFPTMELYAMPAATQMVLDDSIVDMDAWIAEEVRTAFAIQEGRAFVTGDGVNRPKGFLTYPVVNNDSWSWGNLGAIATGVSAAFPTANPSDRLIDLTFALKAPYRANARFVMNRATLGLIRRFRDTMGNYLWQPSARPGETSTLLGYPVVECEDMPSLAANALAIAFGDFRAGYLVVDRVGIRMLRDPYSAKPFVLFYTTKRVGGGVQDFDAIKFLRFGV